MSVKAYLQVIMTVDPENRAAAALTKECLIRDEDVQVIHGFDSMEHAKAYLETDLFKTKVAPGLQPTWAADPDIRFYEVL